MRRVRGAARVGLGLLLALPFPLHGQRAAPPGGDPAPEAPAPALGWFPEARLFQGPLADPHEPRLAGGLLHTDLFAPRDVPPAERPAFLFPEPGEDLRRDLQATVVVGGTLPLWGAAVGGGWTVLLAPQLAVHNRFRVERASRDDVGGDWVVALPLEFTRGAGFAGRVRLSHRSAHLGDEVMQRAGVTRLEFSYEAVDVLLSVRPVGRLLRVYGGGGAIVASNVFRVLRRESDQRLVLRADFRDRLTLQAGAEAETRPRGGAGYGFLAGADLQWVERTGYDLQLSLIAGVTGRARGREARLVARWLDGPSSLGEFFLTDESAFGLELVLGL